MRLLETSYVFIVLRVRLQTNISRRNTQDLIMKNKIYNLKIMTRKHVITKRKIFTILSGNTDCFKVYQKHLLLSYTKLSHARSLDKIII